LLLLETFVALNGLSCADLPLKTAGWIFRSKSKVQERGGLWCSCQCSGEWSGGRWVICIYCFPHPLSYFSV